MTFHHFLYTIDPHNTSILKPNIFIYIASNFLLLHLVSLQSAITNQVIHALCALGILTLGIAHGSIDNILYGVKPGRSNIVFIIRYVLVVGLFGLVWIFFPNVAFLLFLLVSSYHFGQSQFVEYNLKPKFLSKCLYMLWGALILLLMFHFNGAELLELQASEYQFYPALSHIIYYSYHYLVTCSVLYGILFFGLTYLNQLSLQFFFKESYVLLLVVCSMYLFPAFIAFSLFFVWIHSFKVILQEFEYCKRQLNIKKIWEFIRLFLPLTVVSLLGTLCIVLLVFQFGEAHFLPNILLILLSCLTIPHSFVMDKFYGFLSSRS